MFCFTGYTYGFWADRADKYKVEFAISSLVHCLSPPLVQAVARTAFALALPKLPAAGPLLQHSTAPLRDVCPRERSPC